MISTTQLSMDFGFVMDDWPKEQLFKGTDWVYCLVDETTFSKKVADGGLVSDFGGAVFVRKDDLTFPLDAKEQVQIRDRTYKVLTIQESADQVHLRIALQVIGR